MCVRAAGDCQRCIFFLDVDAPGHPHRYDHYYSRKLRAVSVFLTKFDSILASVGYPRYFAA